MQRDVFGRRTSVRISGLSKAQTRVLFTSILPVQELQKGSTRLKLFPTEELAPDSLQSLLKKVESSLDGLEDLFGSCLGEGDWLLQAYFISDPPAVRWRSQRNDYRYFRTNTIRLTSTIEHHL